MPNFLRFLAITDLLNPNIRPISVSDIVPNNTKHSLGINNLFQPPIRGGFTCLPFLLHLAYCLCEYLKINDLDSHNLGYHTYGK